MRIATFLTSSVALALGCTLALPAQAQQTRGMGIFALDPVSEGNALLNLTGTGRVEVEPDLAVITAGVQTTAQTAGDAMRQNAQTTQEVLRALRRAGIAERDIQTSQVSLTPVWNTEYPYYDAAYLYGAEAAADAAAEPVKPAAEDALADAAAAAVEAAAAAPAPRIVGYRASNAVTVRQRDLDELGGLFDALVAAGANTVAGPDFQLEESEGVIAQARDLAIADARAEAEAYARAAGLRVRRIMLIEEGTVSGLSSSGNQFAYLEAAAAYDYGVPTPTAQGELGVTVSVGIMFELAPN